MKKMKNKLPDKPSELLMVAMTEDLYFKETANGFTFFVDYENKDFVESFIWWYKKDDGKAGHINSNSLCFWQMFGTKSLHRVLLGAKTGDVGDHINGNTLDNTMKNIRICTHSINNANKRSPNQSRGEYRGIRLRCGKYYVQIMKNKKCAHLGSYKCKHLAASIYNEAYKKLFGVGCFLNNIPLEVIVNRGQVEEAMGKFKHRLDPMIGILQAEGL